MTENEYKIVRGILTTTGSLCFALRDLCLLGANQCFHLASHLRELSAQQQEKEKNNAAGT